MPMSLYIYKKLYNIGICGQSCLRSLEVNTTVNMTVQVVSICLVIVSSILCSGTQQGVSSTQAGQTLQIQPNVRKYNNKHTVTEKPCATGSTTTGTRKDKPENYSDTQDYVPIGGSGGSLPAPTGYPYYAPYPYQPYQPGGNYPYRLQYPYEPVSYPADAFPPAQVPYYGPPPAQSPYYGPPPYYPVAPYYPASPSYHPAAYPAPPQQLYDQPPTIVDAYRSPVQPALPAEQPQYHRQPVPYAPQQSFSLPHIRAHAYSRPGATATPPYLQQRDVTATATAPTNAAEPSQQYEPAQQQPAGSFDSNQYHY